MSKTSAPKSSPVPAPPPVAPPAPIPVQDDEASRAAAEAMRRQAKRAKGRQATLLSDEWSKGESGTLLGGGGSLG